MIENVSDDDVWPFSNITGPKKDRIVKVSELTIVSKFDKSLLTEMSKKQLIDLAKANMVNVKSRATKQELINAIMKL